MKIRDGMIPDIWTVGHSTRSSEEFLKILNANQIEAVVDVRAFPSSRRYPQFNRDSLARALALAGVEYQHFYSLGGKRQPTPDSKNTAWKNASFRAYADHMETEEFGQGVRALLQLASQRRTAAMCAEAVWWRCHRSLISDYLKAQGLTVGHILDAGRVEEHPYTEAARIVDGKLSYAGLLHGAGP